MILAIYGDDFDFDFFFGDDDALTMTERNDTVAPFSGTVTKVTFWPNYIYRVYSFFGDILNAHLDSKKPKKG